MRYFLIYFSWLGMWVCSHFANLYYGTNNPYSEIWMEAARFMIFFSIAAFAYLAADKRERTLKYQVQIEHIVFIVGAKAIQHFCYFLNVCGLVNEIDPYAYSVINYILAGAYVVVTPIRIIYLKNKAFWKS